MVRVKSEAVRDAILASAAAEISASGYLNTTIGRIAKGAGIAPSNVYVYFASKLEIYFTIYEPWFKAQFAALERSVARQPTREKKVRRLVQGIMRDIADDPSGYTAALMEALAAIQPKDKYRPDLLAWAEDRIEHVILKSVGGYETGDPRLKAFAHLLMLTFDGTALRAKALRANLQQDQKMAAVEDLLMALVTGPPPKATETQSDRASAPV